MNPPPAVLGGGVVHGKVGWLIAYRGLRLTHAVLLSKAFDTLNFNILRNKLKFYRITCTSLKLLDNYLRNRHQFVVFKNINLDLQEMQTAIPHESILGPLFFSIYINDFINSSNIFNYYFDVC